MNLALLVGLGVGGWYAYQTFVNGDRIVEVTDIQGVPVGQIYAGATVMYQLLRKGKHYGYYAVRSDAEAQLRALKGQTV